MKACKSLVAVKTEPGLLQLKTPLQSGDDHPIPKLKVYIEFKQERCHHVMIEEGMASIKDIAAEVEKLAKSLQVVPAKVVKTANIPSPDSNIPLLPEIAAASEAAIILTTTNVTVDGPADETMDKDVDGSEDEDWTRLEVPEQVEMPGKNVDEDEAMETTD
jgi:hypothetical protein